jgi:hypothetical protein
MKLSKAGTKALLNIANCSAVETSENIGGYDELVKEGLARRERGVLHKWKFLKTELGRREAEELKARQPLDAKARRKGVA